MINTIIDIYHGNDIDFQKAWNGGIIAIIHKATQGIGIRDSTYHDRRARAKKLGFFARAKKLGFLWGAYHFSTGGSISDQVANFLTYAKPEDDELISLDWEPSDGPDMTLEQAQHFVQIIRDETGRWPVVYGGHLLREQIGHNPDPILSNCPLWYVRYADSPIGIPTQVWASYTLWQYTDGDVGPEPHGTPGATGRRSKYLPRHHVGAKGGVAFYPQGEGDGARRRLRAYFASGWSHFKKEEKGRVKPRRFCNSARGDSPFA